MTQKILKPLQCGNLYQDNTCINNNNFQSAINLLLLLLNFLKKKLAQHRSDYTAEYAAVTGLKRCFFYALC
jgi:hypothetical protein